MQDFGATYVRFHPAVQRALDIFHESGFLSWLELLAEADTLRYRCKNQFTCLMTMQLLLCIANAQAQNAAPQRPNPMIARQRAQALAWNTLTTAISDHNAIHRQQAVDALSTLGGMRRVVRMVELRLTDKNAAVRADAATALAEMNSRQSLPKLRKALNDESEQVQFAVARALWKMGDHSGRGVLLEVLQGESTPSNGMIRQGLDDANRKMRSPRQLALLGINEASSALLGPFSFGVKMAEQLAKDKSADARALSASLLAFDHDPESVSKLRAALHDKSSLVRLAAAKALGQHPCSQLVPDLLQLSDSDKDAIKFMAAASILRISANAKAVLPAGRAECELSNPDVKISSRAPEGSAVR